MTSLRFGAMCKNERSEIKTVAQEITSERYTLAMFPIELHSHMLP